MTREHPGDHYAERDHKGGHKVMFKRILGIGAATALAIGARTGCSIGPATYTVFEDVAGLRPDVDCGVDEIALTEG